MRLLLWASIFIQWKIEKDFAQNFASFYEYGFINFFVEIVECNNAKNYIHAKIQKNYKKIKF